MENARVGDKVKAMGITVEIAEIHYQDYYDNEGWNIEFRDTTGKYRSWKQYIDKGELIRKGVK